MTLTDEEQMLLSKLRGVANKIHSDYEAGLITEEEYLEKFKMFEETKKEFEEIARGE